MTRESLNIHPLLQGLIASKSETNLLSAALSGKSYALPHSTCSKVKKYNASSESKQPKKR